MFVQVIQGPVRSEAEVRSMLERWEEELLPGATGWLGTTAGVTPENRLVLIVRFASVEDARANSERREQDAWWEEMEKRFVGEPTFHDCEDVATLLGGGDDRAGFVQVLEGPRGTDDHATQLAAVGEDLLRRYRPDILGGLVAIAPDRLFEVVYFTSEEEAREREREDLPDEVAAEMNRQWGPGAQPIFHDLPSPLLRSAG